MLFKKGVQLGAGSVTFVLIDPNFIQKKKKKAEWPTLVMSALGT